MRRYIKIGAFTLTILLVGMVVGSGSIGDIIRATVAGFSAKAERSEVEDTRESLANEYAERIGQPLGAEAEQISISSAMRCNVLARAFAGDKLQFIDFTDEQRQTIAANSNAIIYNRAELDKNEVSHISSQLFIMRGPYEGSGRSNDQWQTDAIEFENVCSPLLGRRLSQP